jgi:hypothetical protein
MLPVRSVVAIGFCLILAVVSPATAQEPVPDRIKKIALIPAPEPVEYVALTKNSQFGLIGGIIAAVQSAENTGKMTEAMTRAEARLGAWLSDTLEARLRAQNIEIVRVAATREKPHELLKDYAQIDTDADAILDIVIRMVGYYRLEVFDDFGPGMRVELRLVSPKTKQVILDDDPGYGLANNWSNKHKYDPKYVFANMDRLRERLVLAKEGMEQGSVPISDEIAGKISEINRLGIAASIVAAKSKVASDEPDAKRSDDRGSN